MGDVGEKVERPILNIEGEPGLTLEKVVARGARRCGSTLYAMNVDSTVNRGVSLPF